MEFTCNLKALFNQILVTLPSTWYRVVFVQLTVVIENSLTHNNVTPQSRVLFAIHCVGITTAARSTCDRFVIVSNEIEKGFIRLFDTLTSADEIHYTQYGNNRKLDEPLTLSVTRLRVLISDLRHFFLITFYCLKDVRRKKKATSSVTVTGSLIWFSNRTQHIIRCYDFFVFLKYIYKALNPLNT